MDKSPSLPWYKYPFVWFALSIPLAAVIAGIGMIYLAVTTDDGLVADDYYKQGLAINKSIKRERNASELGISADFEYDAELNRILLILNKGHLPEYPDNIAFRLQHVLKSDFDQQIELMHGQNNQYIGYIKGQLPQGVWHAELATEDWRIGARIHLLSTTTIKLLPEVYQ